MFNTVTGDSAGGHLTEMVVISGKDLVSGTKVTELTRRADGTFETIELILKENI